MPKYSAKSSGVTSTADACELCGEETASLDDVVVAGATLQVCSSCASHDDSTTSQDTSSEEQRGPSTPPSTGSSMWDSDTSSWETEGTGYSDDPLPYLVDGYGDVVETGRTVAGLSVEEVARNIGVDEMTILAIERGQAARADIPGTVIEDLEEHLDIKLTDE